MSFISTALEELTNETIARRGPTSYTQHIPTATTRLALPGYRPPRRRIIDFNFHTPRQKWL